MRFTALLAALMFLALPRAAFGQTYARVHHPVSTASAAAQTYFDQGLTFMYAFSRAAARQAFEQAAKADPHLAMAYWGIALSYGPNINVAMDPEGQRAAAAAIRHAQSLGTGASSTGEERAFISALALRYAATPNAKPGESALAYCNAMRALYYAYPDDSDAAALFAESEMDLHPWALYTTDGNPIAGTAEIVETLKTVLKRDPQHIGANHFLIHATEASKSPEQALPSAFRLRNMTFEPAAAHLVHMPAHTFMRTGYYANAVASNIHATAKDRMVMSTAHELEGDLYFGHDLFFLSSAATMRGDFATAQRAATEMVTQDALEPLLFVYLRFHRWQDILAMPAPKTSNYEPLRIPVWWFARGMAHAGTADFADAKRDLAVLESSNASMQVQGVNGFYNGSREIIDVASDLLGAKLAWNDGDRKGATAQLEHAVASQDGFLYIEPPDWYGPAREALGAALFQQRDFSSAEQVFRADLARNPRNPRSLFGLMAALKSEGRADDATYVRLQFQRGWIGAPLSMTSLW